MKNILLIDYGVKNSFFENIFELENDINLVRIIDKQQIYNSIIEFKPSLILIDFLQCKNGIIKSIKKINNKIPIIILIAKDDEIKNKFANKEITDYVVKPANIKKFLEKVRYHMI